MVFCLEQIFRPVVRLHAKHVLTFSVTVCYIHDTRFDWNWLLIIREYVCLEENITSMKFSNFYF
jgi:hypothetical protein